MRDAGVFRESPPTLGEAILAAKRRTMTRIDDEEHPVGLNRMLLDGVAAMMSPNKELLDAERREHLHIFNLLGDPMLALVHPQTAELQAEREASAGERIRNSGRSAIAGRGVLELVCRRDCNKQEPPTRERFDPTDKALAEYQRCMSNRSIAALHGGVWSCQRESLQRKLRFRLRRAGRAICDWWWLARRRKQ